MNYYNSKQMKTSKTTTNGERVEQLTDHSCYGILYKNEILIYLIPKYAYKYRMKKATYIMRIPRMRKKHTNANDQKGIL